MTIIESKDWAISKLLETADQSLLTQMFREVAYKYGLATKQFKIDLYNAYALATQKAVAGTLTSMDIQKLSAMAYFGNCSNR